MKEVYGIFCDEFQSSLRVILEEVYRALTP